MYVEFNNNSMITSGNSELTLFKLELSTRNAACTYGNVVRDMYNKLSFFIRIYNLLYFEPKPQSCP